MRIADVTEIPCEFTAFIVQSNTLVCAACLWSHVYGSIDEGEHNSPRHVTTEKLQQLLQKRSPLGQ